MKSVMSIEEICLELSNVKKRMKNFNRVVVIGAGFGGRMACDELEKLGIEILFVCDNDIKKHTDKFFYSKKYEKWGKCCSFDKLKEIDDDVVCLLSLRGDNMVFINQLNNLNVRNYINCFLYIRSFYVEEIKTIYNKLEREESKRTLATLLTVDLTGNTKLYETIYKKEQYFAIPEFAGFTPNEVMCDLGAYVGDTIEAYIWKKMGVFNKIYAFEPGNKNFKAMESRVKRLKEEWAIDDNRIKLVKAAVSNEDSIGFATQEEKTGLRIDENGDKEIDIIKLDTFFKEDSITYLIADIEGEELKTLEGMEQVIIRDKPKFAIAIYHRATDIFEIPNKLLSLRNDYNFDIVHHRQDSLDTVLYAY